MKEIYAVVQLSKAWDWERESVILVSENKDLCDQMCKKLEADCGGMKTDFRRYYYVESYDFSNDESKIIEFVNSIIEDGGV